MGVSKSPTHSDFDDSSQCSIQIRAFTHFLLLKNITDLKSVIYCKIFPQRIKIIKIIIQFSLKNDVFKASDFRWKSKIKKKTIKVDSDQDFSYYLMKFLERNLEFIVCPTWAYSSKFYGFCDVSSRRGSTLFTWGRVFF